MNKSTAYAIAKAVETKLGIPISLQQANGLFIWSNGEIGYAVVHTTDKDPRTIAQSLVVDLKPLPSKRKKVLDD